MGITKLRIGTSTTQIFRHNREQEPEHRPWLRFVRCSVVMPKKQKFPHLVGSKWTALQKTFGWRHFRVVNRKNQGKWVFAELVAACDPEVRFWLNANSLRDRSLWQAGWQSLGEMQGDSSSGGADIALAETPGG